jgi:hypothetical protein
MMKRETIPIADVYVPIKRRATLEQKRVDELAAKAWPPRGTTSIIQSVFGRLTN